MFQKPIGIFFTLVWAQGGGVMLKIIHTGRAHEILDLTSVDYCRLERIELRGLRAEYTTLRLHHRQQDKLLGKTCREVWQLKELLENTELELTRCKAEYDQLEEAFDAGWWPERLRVQKAEAETEQLRRLLHDERIRRDEWKKMYHQAVMPELKLCQKSTPDTHESQDPH